MGPGSVRVVALIVVGFALLGSFPLAASMAPTVGTAPAVPVAGAVAAVVPAGAGAVGWVNLSSSLGTAPTPRMYPSMAYDPQLGGVLLFGGGTHRAALGGNVTYNDTWLFANGTWTNLTYRYPAEPPARWAASLVWDPLDHYMLLFGGRASKAPPNGVPGFVNDTWTFNASTGWSRLSPSRAPSPRGFSPVVYDPKLSALLLYSGGDIDFSNGTRSSFNETWTFAGGAWTNITATSGAGSRQSSALAYDPALGAILSAGIMANNSLCTPLRQTWMFNGTWNKLNLTGPPPGGSMTYDPTLGADLYTGGCVPVNHAPLALTWEYASGNWTNITGSLTSSPAATCCAGMAYDPIEKIDLRFGGNRLVPSTSTGYENFTYSFPVAPLTARVASSSLAGTAPLSVNLTSRPAGGDGSYTFLWSLGDGSANASTLDVNHTYSSPGTYPVRYEVTDTGGRSYNVTLTIRVGADLVLGISATPTTGEAPLPVTFNVTSATGGFAPYNVSWAFGDGGVAFSSNVSYTYLIAGNFTATATLTDSVGDSLVRTVAVDVVGAVSAAAVANVTAGVAPFAVGFSGSASGGLGPYTYAWTFGDGASASGPSAAHTYASPGTYTATLNVTDAYLRSSLATVSVEVVAPLAASASGAPASGVAPLPVAFSAAPTGGLAPFTYAWNFGDGTTASGAQPSHTYAAPGNFTATVSIADALGETALASVTVDVVSPLSVAATASAAAAVSPAVIQFRATPGGGLGPYTYSWTFGDGASGSGATTSHTYSAPGNYSVTVTATDTASETATTHLAVEVVAALTASVAASATSFELGSAVVLTVTVSGGLAPAAYTWTSVPTGCSGTAASQLECTPTAAGTYTVTVDVTDALHESVNTSVTVTVTSASGSSSSGPFAGLSTPILIGVIVVLVVIAALAYLLLRDSRRRPAAPAAEPSGPREIEAPPSEEGAGDVPPSDPA